MTSSSPKNEVNCSCDLGICWSTTIPSGLKTTTFPSAFGLVSLSKSGSKIIIRIAATTNKKIENQDQSEQSSNDPESIQHENMRHEDTEHKNMQHQQDQNKENS